MTLKEFCARTGLSDKTVRNWVKEGWLQPTVTVARYGKQFEFADADVERAMAIATDVKAGKIKRNRDHRTAVIAAQWDRERAAGGKVAQQATQMLAKGEKPAVIFARMLANRRDISRMDWNLLRDVQDLAYGTHNEDLLAGMHAPLPQTLDRIRRRVLAKALGKPQAPRKRRGYARVQLAR